MKKNMLYCLLATLLFCGLTINASAQSKKEEKQKAQQEIMEKTKALIDQQNYVFVAEQMMPIGLKEEYLSIGYELRVTKDKITSILPYKGMAYSVRLDPAEQGIAINSESFDYNVKESKKGWKIKAKTKDGKYTYSIVLDIKGENATLEVSSNDRQSVTFFGKIVDPATL